MEFKVKNFSLLIDGILSLVGGLILLMMAIFAFDSLVNIVCITIGVFIIIYNIYVLVISLNLLGLFNLGLNTNVSDDKVKTYAFVSSLLSILGIVLGLWFVFNHGLALTIVFGAYLIIFPLFRLLFATDKKKQIKQEIPNIVVAIIVILLACFGSLASVLRILVIVFASIITLLGVCYLILYEKGVKVQIPSDDNALNEQETIEVEATETKEE